MKKNMASRIKVIALISILFTLISFDAKSQISFNLPNGYQTKDGNGELGARNDNDFDNDGINDLAIVCFRKDGSDPIVVVYLTSKYLIDKTYFWFPWQHMFNDFEFKNNVLTLTSNDMGRYGTTLKLKYYSNLNNMKLIGYGEDYIGDSYNNGAYSITINLNTNEYEIKGVRRKINIDLITLSNIEKYFKYLTSIGENYKR
jgi:hypothetical protein